MKLSDISSARRLAKMWVDLSPDKRKEMLSCLDTDSRTEVITRMVEIRIERQRNNT